MIEYRRIIYQKENVNMVPLVVEWVILFVWPCICASSTPNFEVWQVTRSSHSENVSQILNVEVELLNHECVNSLINWIKSPYEHVKPGYSMFFWLHVRLLPRLEISGPYLLHRAANLPISGLVGHSAMLFWPRVVHILIHTKLVLSFLISVYCMTRPLYSLI